MQFRPSNQPAELRRIPLPRIPVNRLYRLCTSTQSRTTISSLRKNLSSKPALVASRVEKVRSATAYAGVGEALARKVALPLLLDLARKLLLAHLAASSLALGTEELLLLV